MGLPHQAMNGFQTLQSAFREKQWNTAVQEDAAPATRIPSIRSGTIVEGHYAWKPYEEKTQDLIRKECSLRQIKLNTKRRRWIGLRVFVATTSL
ncbi:hypothetical protein L917_17515 [Phytophthora nicotianae]|nr:hypothetical protein L917_17515 [Phytophthora nicotianae]